MKRAIWLCGLVAFAATGCDNGGDGGPAGPGAVDVNRTLVELVRTENVPANGSDTAIVRVIARDRDGRTVPNREIAAQSSNPSDILSYQPENKRTDENGVAEIHVSASSVGSRVLTITVQGLVLPQRPTLTFVPGDGNQLEFVEVPTVGKAGRPLRPAVRLEVKDTNGNRVFDSEAEVTLQVGSSGTLTEKAVQGLVTFSEVVFDEPGEGILVASSPGMGEVQSDKIDIIIGDPAYLTFEEQPTNLDVGEPFSVRVTVHDPAGNLVVGSNETIRLRLYSNPTGAELGGTIVAQAEEGIATFENLTITKASAGYQLTAAAGGYQTAISDPFTVGSIAPDETNTTLVISGDLGEPSAVANGREQLRIEGRVIDAHGNPLPGIPFVLSATGEGHRFHPTVEGDGTTLVGVTTGAGTISAWISSTRAEVKTVTLRVADIFEKTATATFSAGAVNEGHSTLVPNNEIAVVDVDPPSQGSNGGIQFEVNARDAEDNPIPGVVATISASGVENHVENQVGVPLTTVTTDSEGKATFWFKSSRAEEKTVTVRMSSPSDPMAPDVTLSRKVTFVPDVPDAQNSSRDATTLNQQAIVGTKIDKPFRVHIRDRYGNTVPDAKVTFKVEENNGRLDGSLDEIAVDTIDGEAEVEFTVGTRSGMNVVSWHAGWDGEEPRKDLIAISVPDKPLTIDVLTDTEGLSGTAGGPDPVKVEFGARDAYGNLTGPAEVSFSGDGIYPEEPVSIPAWNLGADPSVTIDWILEEQVGVNKLTATLDDTGDEVEVTALGRSGRPAKILIAKNEVANLKVVSGPVELQVQVLDQFDNPVGGTGVEFKIIGPPPPEEGEEEEEEEEWEFSALAHGKFEEGGEHGPPDGDAVFLTTDENGYASANYLSGQKSGVWMIQATVLGADPADEVFATFAMNVGPDVANKIEIFDGQAQVGTVGFPLDTDLQVLVLDQYSNPVPNEEVTFTISLEPAGANARLGTEGNHTTLPVDSDEETGIASVTFVLGDLPGTYTVTASVADIPEPNSLTFNAEAEVGPPAEVVIAEGDEQKGTVDQGLPDRLVAKVVDWRGNALEGYRVDFSGPEGIVLSHDFMDSDSDGEVWVKVDKLPQESGAVEVVAAVSEEVFGTFLLEALPDRPFYIVHVSGHGQSGTVGRKLPIPLSVRVEDEFRNPKPGAEVQFDAPSAGTFYDMDDNPIDPAIPLVTDEQGLVAIQWEMPLTPATNLMTTANLVNATATPPGVPFLVNAILGPPERMELTLSDGGKAPVDGEVDIDIEVYNYMDTPLDGEKVTLTLLPGVHNASVISASVETSGGGLASAKIGMGTIATTFQLEINVGGFIEVVDLQTLPGQADEIQVIAGNNQSGPVGEALANPIVVKLVDVYGNPMPNESIDFAPKVPGEGSFTPNPATTLEDGTATTSWILHTSHGLQEATAQFDAGGGLIVSADLVATGRDAVATLVAVPAEIDATVGDEVEFEIEAQDSNGDPFEGATLTFVVLNGDATLEELIVDTGSDGKVANKANLGTKAGTVEIQASVDAAQVVLTINSKADVADSIEIASGNNQIGFVDVPLTHDLVVRVVDKHGNPVKEEPVTFSAEGGELTETLLETDVDGLAATSFTPEELGEFKVKATIEEGTTTEVEFEVDVRESPESLEVVAGDMQRINTEKPFSNPVVVRALDAGGEPVEGASVLFTVTDGTLVSSDPETDADGYATAFIKAGSVEGEVVVQAELDEFEDLEAVVFSLVAEDVALCQAAGSVVYYLDADSELQSHEWADGPGTYVAAEDSDANEVAYVDFVEAVEDEPAFGYVHQAIHLDCDGETVDIVASDSGVTLEIDGDEVAWDEEPAGDISYQLDDETGFFAVSCPGGVGVQGYDDGLNHFTRVGITGAAGESFCANPPEIVELEDES